MEDIGFLFCQSCLSGGHGVHFNQSHKLLTRCTRKVSPLLVQMFCTFWIISCSLCRRTRCWGGETLLSFHPADLYQLSFSLWLTFSSLSGIYIYNWRNNQTSAFFPLKPISILLKYFKIKSCLLLFSEQLSITAELFFI